MRLWRRKDAGDDADDDVDDGAHDVRAPEVDPLDDDALTNAALSVVLEFGPERGRDPVERLCERVRGVDPRRAADAVATAKAAEKIGNDYVWDNSSGAGDKARFAPQDGMSEAVLAVHPWVDRDNLGHLYSQSCYWTWHG